MLEQILLNQSHYAPAFFFISKAGMTLTQAEIFIEKIDSKEAPKLTKKRLLDRLKNPEHVAQGALLTGIKHQYAEGKNFDVLVAEVKAALNLTAKRIELQIARTIFYNTLLNNVPIPTALHNKHLKRILEAMSNLPKISITRNKAFILGECAKVFDAERDADQTSLMRKVISNVDISLYFTKPESVKDLADL